MAPLHTFFIWKQSVDHHKYQDASMLAARIPIAVALIEQIACGLKTTACHVPTRHYINLWYAE